MHVCAGRQSSESALHSNGGGSLATQQYSSLGNEIEFTNLAHTRNKVEVTPQGDISLSYSLLLPDNWVKEQEEAAGFAWPGGKWARIGLFSENRNRPDMVVVQVYCTRIPFEVSLLDWMELEAERYGTRLTSCQLYEHATGRVVDAEGVYGSSENEHIVRLVAQIGNGRIFLLVGMVAAARYSAVKEDISAVVGSFNLLQRAGTGHLENIQTIIGAAPAFSVDYPQSWLARGAASKIQGKSGLDLLLARNQQLMAHIRVKAVSQDTEVLSASIASEKATEELQEAGVQITSDWKVDEDRAVNTVGGLTSVVIGDGLLSGSPVEVREGFLKKGHLWFAITLLSAPKSVDRILWMRSKRAYEIALASVRPID
jgi:hypothetical protein